MEEKRKYRRMDLQSRLLVKRLDSKETKEVNIEVTDVSKTGVGFKCDEPLTIGALYEGYLTIWTKEVLHAFLEIVRIEKTEDAFIYGAIFVGMPEMDSSRIEVYRIVEEHHNS